MTLINEPISEELEGARSSDDVVHMALQAATHWDGLGHVSYGGKIWNGYDADAITHDGATRCGIHRISSLTSRGVLLDVAAAKGLDTLDGATPSPPRTSTPRSSTARSRCARATWCWCAPASWATTCRRTSPAT